MDRRELIDALLAYKDLAVEYMPQGLDAYEDILIQYGASDDDTDPDEGYFVTMSDQDLGDALDEIVSTVWTYGIDPILQETRETLVSMQSDLLDILEQIPDRLPEHRYETLEALADSGLQRCIDVLDGEI